MSGFLYRYLPMLQTNGHEEGSLSLSPVPVNVKSVLETGAAHGRHSSGETRVRLFLYVPVPQSRGMCGLHSLSPGNE